MTLSIIIVNYNVKYFLEHCLYSVQKAAQGIDTEVLVIDNDSADNSVNYLKPLFPEVVFVENKENMGFGRANNLGLKMAKGNYILFLNPDTLIQEDSLRKCITAFEADEKIGAIGVRMIDGSGRFLKESKRSFPSPSTSMYKLFGLSKLFPHSPVFSKYHLGHLNDKNNHVVDVLAGAFMMIRSDVLQKTGGFDKDFFMYGEDIDLSYRIQKAKYKNLYLADTTIIHFKGESTNLGSLNYVKMFYQAMEIFVKKHYGSTRKSIFIILLQIGIWLRAFLSILSGIIKKAGLVIVDALIFLSCFWVSTLLWNRYIKPETDYPETLLWIAFSIFTILYIGVAWFWGLYDKKGYRTKNVISAAIFAIVILLALYSLLPEHYRFSRGIVLLGSLLGYTTIFFFRQCLIKTGIIKSNQKKAIHYVGLIAGNKQDFQNILKIVHQTGEEDSFVGYTDDIDILETMQKDLIVQKIIFCENTYNYADIITMVEKMPHQLQCRFYCGLGKTIIGSYSKNESGIAASYKYYRLNDPFYRRIKRLFDITTALFFLFSLPVHLFFIKNPAGFITNIVSVLSGKKTWVGFTAISAETPLYKPGIIPLTSSRKNSQPTAYQPNNTRIDDWYAKNYSVNIDLNRIIFFYKKLGQKIN